MRYKVLFTIFLFILCVDVPSIGQTTSPEKAICGKWQCTDKSIIIDVYLENNQFKAKLVWYSDTEGKPMDYWTDIHNPDPALRSRKILGLSMLSDLVYQSKTNSWEDGMVYDSKHGREWNASASIDKKGMLHVRGYWHFKFIGRTMEFTRYTSSKLP